MNDKPLTGLEELEALSQRGGRVNLVLLDVNTGKTVRVPVDLPVRAAGEPPAGCRSRQTSPIRRSSPGEAANPRSASAGAFPRRLGRTSHDRSAHRNEGRRRPTRKPRPESRPRAGRHHRRRQRRADHRSRGIERRRAQERATLVAHRSRHTDRQRHPRRGQARRRRARAIQLPPRPIRRLPPEPIEDWEPSPKWSSTTSTRRSR